MNSFVVPLRQYNCTIPLPVLLTRIRSKDCWECHNYRDSWEALLSAFQLLPRPPNHFEYPGFLAWCLHKDCMSQRNQLYKSKCTFQPKSYRFNKIYYFSSLFSEKGAYDINRYMLFNFYQRS